jgi:PadR family transcriptional regulator PadR
MVDPLIPGTLNVLILQALSRGAMHGYGISKWIVEHSRDVFRAEEGVLYPALHRLERDGCLEAEWGQNETGRRAKFYTLTSKGKERLEAETERWRRSSRALDAALGIGEP